jgi:hypothetical protein
LTAHRGELWFSKNFFLRFPLGHLLSALLTALLASFRSRAALQLEILALPPSTWRFPPLRQATETDREQQKPGAAEPNLLILWRRGCINSKIDSKNIGLCAADASLCAKTFGGFPDFATICRRDPRGSAALHPSTHLNILTIRHPALVETGRADNLRGGKTAPDLADAGGSNGNRLRAWKVHLQELADQIQITITVCHYPPGTSKWNKIEHRLFSVISLNWKGQPLVNYETIINLIGGTRTRTGLKVKAVLDTNEYETGLKLSEEQLEGIRLRRHRLHQAPGTTRSHLAVVSSPSVHNVHIIFASPASANPATGQGTGLPGNRRAACSLGPTSTPLRENGTVRCLRCCSVVRCAGASSRRLSQGTSHPAARRPLSWVFVDLVGKRKRIRTVPLLPESRGTQCRTWHRGRATSSDSRSVVRSPQMLHCKLPGASSTPPDDR